MARTVLVKFNKFFNNIERYFVQKIFGKGHPPDAFCLAGAPSAGHLPYVENSEDRFSIENLIGDGILWGVPKHRRSVEKRLNRKYGMPEYVWKLLKPKTTLRVCNRCGHHYEVGLLCAHCYNKIREETKVIKDEIQEKLGLEPIENDVIVLYDGEKTDQMPKEIVDGKRVIEMKKSRPMWFSKNLIQKTTQQPAISNAQVKPNDLG